MSGWDFACPDWADRLKDGKSIVPDLPLDDAEAARAVAIFNKLRLPDVPGQPELRDAAGEWQRDIVRALFGSVQDGVRHVPELLLMVPKKSSKTTMGAALTITALLMNQRPRAEMIYVGPTQEVADLAFQQTVGMEQRVVVPASEIIHDRFNCFFHPLVGLSPIFANGLAATQGLAIQNSSTQYYQNGSMPGGILVAAGHIDQNDAEEMKASWEANYGGRNRGKVAVLGDGLKFEQLSMKNTDAQTIEQLKWSAEVVCSTYHVPPYKIGIGQAPTYNNVQALNVEYYSQALQVLIEAIELCLDEGLNTGESLGTEFDIDNLLRMDSVTQMDVLDKAAGIMTIDEMRRRLGLGKTTGGADVYLQQQNFSLTALQKRDQQDDPFGTGGGSSPAPAADEEPEMTPAAAQDAARAILEAEFKVMAPVLALPKPQRAA